VFVLVEVAIRYCFVCTLLALLQIRINLDYELIWTNTCIISILVNLCFNLESTLTLQSFGARIDTVEFVYIGRWVTCYVSLITLLALSCFCIQLKLTVTLSEYLLFNRFPLLW